MREARWLIHVHLLWMQERCTLMHAKLLTHPCLPPSMACLPSPSPRMYSCFFCWWVLPTSTSVRKLRTCCVTYFPPQVPTCWAACMFSLVGDLLDCSPFASPALGWMTVNLMFDNLQHHYPLPCVGAFFMYFLQNLQVAHFSFIQKECFFPWKTAPKTSKFCSDKEVLWKKSLISMNNIANV